MLTLPGTGRSSCKPQSDSMAAVLAIGTKVGTVTAAGEESACRPSFMVLPPVWCGVSG